VIEFMHDAHMDRFRTAAAALEFKGDLPADWAACLFILTADSEIWKLAARYVDLDGHLISWPAMRRKVDGGHEWRILLQLAQNLYGGDCKIDVQDMCYVLDAHNWLLALRAMQLKRCGSRYLKMVA